LPGCFAEQVTIVDEPVSAIVRSPENTAAVILGNTEKAFVQVAGFRVDLALV